MFRKNQNPQRPGFPFSRPSNTPEPAETFEEFMERLQSIFEGDDQDAYFEAIEAAPVRWQRKPELMTARAVGYFRSGDSEMGMQTLNEIERTHPRHVPVYYYKARQYMLMLFPAHALRMKQKAHSLGELDPDAESQLSDIETIARGMIEESARILGVKIEVMEKAAWSNEAAQEKLAAGNWRASEQNARESLRFIPHWVSPRNNLSFVLYYAGKVSDAIAEAQKVLEMQPGNFHALKNLAIFHLGLEEEEKALEYARAMKQSASADEEKFSEYDVLIQTLGLLNDHEALWELSKRFIGQAEEELLEVSWYALGVAALHFDKLKDALKLLEKAEPYYEPAGELAIETRKAIRSKTKPKIPQFYYASIGTFLPHVILGDLIEIFSKHKGDGDLPAHLRRKMDEYLQPRPFVINALLRMLPDPYAAKGVPGILLSLNRPELDARLLEFALSDKGDDNVRLNVISALGQAGRELPSNPIRFWNAELGKWLDVEYSGQMLTDDVELNISDAASVWMQKAHETDDLDRKIEYLRKAVELDPQSGYAVHMLGVHLMKNGQREEGKRLAKKAVEVDPHYMFAYANLALIEAQEDEPDTELVRKYIRKVTQAPVITEQTAFYAHVAGMYLAFDQRDFTAAQREFQIASEIRPDDPILDGWEERLRMAEVFSDNFFEDFQKQSRERAHKKAINTKLELGTTSEATLNSLSREALAEVARFWGVTTYGRKAVLIANISREMQDEAALDRAVEKLSANEKDALAWVLENGGARSFDAFSEKWGNDLEVSPYWQYHEPETVMGRLRMSALLAKGTLDGGQVVFVPADIRPLIKTQ